jgi:hypothetical protein
MLTRERAGRDRRHAPPRRTLNNLPLMFTSTKGKPVLADAPTNFLRFHQHPVYNSIGRIGTKSEADLWHQESSWECYYCNELAIFTENVHISWNKLLCYRICYDLHCSIRCQRVQVLWSDRFRMSSLLRLFRKESFKGARRAG